MTDDEDRFGTCELREAAEEGNTHAQRNLQQIKQLQEDEEGGAA